MMTALPDYRHAPLNSLSDKVIARLPESAFGNTEWVTMTTRTAAEHLRAAIASNRPYRIANAVRSMAHAPRLDDVETLASTICETIVSEGYATRCAETIAKVTNARHVINTVISELRGDVEHALPDLARLRESVQGYVQLVGLHDPRLAERLAAVGAFGGRIARCLCRQRCIARLSCAYRTVAPRTLRRPRVPRRLARRRNSAPFAHHQRGRRLRRSRDTVVAVRDKASA